MLETDTSAYLIREWVQYSLYDRISTRPFLTETEKLWITYQLMYGLHAAHARGVAHGDLKSENIMVTSSLTVYLTDFAASYKPTYLPLDDPSDFSLFFDATGRRTCYLAPERFYESVAELPGRKERRPQNRDRDSVAEILSHEPYLELLGVGRPDGPVTEAMDVFSLGCVLAELWRDGTPLFSLSQLFRYRSHDYDIEPMLKEIPHVQLRGLVRSMLHLDPADRPTLEALLEQAQANVFPYSFSAIWHLYLLDLQRLNSVDEEPPSTKAAESTRRAERWELRRVVHSLEPDDRIERLYEDWCTLSRFLGEAPLGEAEDVYLCASIPGVDLPDKVPRHVVTTDGEALVVLNVILSNIQHAQRASSRCHALELLMYLVWGWLSDEARWDRALPYILALLDDPHARVRAMALHATAVVLESANGITASNDGILPDVVAPHLSPLSRDSSVHVRSMAASCMERLVTETLRLTTQQSGDALDADLQAMQTFVRDQMRAFVQDAAPQVRRAALAQLSAVAPLLGPMQLQNDLLGHVFTYLNDSHGEVRRALFQAIAELQPMLDAQWLDEYMRPLLLQAFGDLDPMVLVEALRSFQTLVPHMRGTALWELLQYMTSLLCHPLAYVREASVGVLEAAAEAGGIERWMQVYVLLRPYLLSDVDTCSSQTVWKHLCDPIPTSVFEACVDAAAKSTPLAAFWRARATPVVVDAKAWQSQLRKDLDTIVRPPTVPARPRTELSSEKERHALEALAGWDVERDGWKVSAMWWYMERMASAPPAPPVSRVPDTSLPGVPQHNIFFAPRTKPLQVPSSTSIRIAQERLQSQAKEAESRSTLVASQSDTVAEQHVDMLETHGRTRDARDSSLGNATPRQRRSSVKSENKPELPAPRMLSRAATAPSARVAPIVDDAGSISERSVKLPLYTISSAATTTTSLITAHAEKASVEHPRRPLGLVSEAQLGGGTGHTYDGTDPYIHAHLDMAYSVLRQRADAANVLASSALPPSGNQARRAPNSNQRPQGALVAYFHEHRDAITALSVSDDEVFFVSGSRDGTVRVWDTARLEKNVTARSRLTYTAHHAPITAVMVLQHTHCVVSAARDGSLHAWGVTMKFSEALWQYDRPQILGRRSLEENEYVTCWQQQGGGTAPSVLLGTNAGRLLTWDIRTMKLSAPLSHPKSWGAVVGLVLDPGHLWACVGTSRGFLVLWDLRFEIRLKVWKVRGDEKSEARISALTLHPTRPRCVLVAWDTPSAPLMVSFDLEHGKVLDVWHITDVGAREDALTSDVLIAPLNKEEDGADDNDALRALLSLRRPPSSTAVENTTAVCALAASVNGYVSSSSTPSAPPAGYVLSAGADRMVRYWDLGKAENSVAWGRRAHGEFTYTRGSPGHVCHVVQLSAAPAFIRPLDTQGVSTREPVLSHTDTITALARLEAPFRCTVAGDRTGALLVWE